MREGIYTEHQWKVTNDSRTLNKGALLGLSEQRIAVCSAFIFVVYRPMYRYYRKWFSSWMKSWHPFVNEHQLFSLVSTENSKVVALPENWSLAFSIFMEYLSGIQPHVYFWKCFQILKIHKKTKSCSIVTGLAEQIYCYRCVCNIPETRNVK